MIDVIAAALVGLAFVALVRLVLRPDTHLSDRLAPYSQLQAIRFGRRPDIVAAVDVAGSEAHGARGWFDELGGKWALRLSDFLDVDGGEGIRLLLRRAGRNDMTVEDFRREQLKSTVSGCAGGGVLGWLLFGGSIPALFLGAGLGALVGGLWFRRQVSREAERRTATMRLELYTVAQVLAMLVKANHGPVAAVRVLTERAAGPTVGELNLALGWIEAGTPISTAFYRLAADVDDQAVARLFRLIGHGASSGGDIGETLLGYAYQLRSERREDIEKKATKRRAAMMIPIIFFSLPVAFIYVAAPIPSILRAAVQ